MSRKHNKIAPVVAAILILSLLLTYFLMSGTMSSVNDISEQEALALLTENAMQMDNIIENQLYNNWKQIDTVCVALENMENYSVNEVVSFLQNGLTDTYDVLLRSDDGNYLNRNGQWGLKQIAKDILPLIQDEERILRLKERLS